MYAADSTAHYMSKKSKSYQNVNVQNNLTTNDEMISGFLTFAIPLIAIRNGDNLVEDNFFKN